MAEKKQEFECIYCKESFDDESKYYNHRDKISCMCDFCGEIFKDRTQFIQHLSEHINDGLFKCLMCNETNNDIALLLYHITLHRENPFKCKKCEAEFFMKISLVNHIKKHNYHWECDDCKFEAKTLKDLEEHKKSHEKEKQDRFYNVDEFMPTGLQFRDRFTNETIFIHDD